MRKTIRTVCLLLATLVVGTAPLYAHGATVSFWDSVSFQSTNWSKTVTIPKFDPSLGTLNWISFELEGIVKSTVSLENLGSSPTSITTNLTATLTLSRPDSSTITFVNPLLSFAGNLAAFDGTFDFSGTSGVVFTGLTLSGSVVKFSPPPASDLPLFTGTGNIVLPVTAVVNGNVSGPGNLITLFVSGSSADVKVTYDYTPAGVPAPAAVWAGALLLAGLIANHFHRRRGA